MNSNLFLRQVDIADSAKLGTSESLRTAAGPVQRGPGTSWPCWSRHSGGMILLRDKGAAEGICF